MYVKHGNHDAQSAMPKTLHPPDNVRVFRADAAHTFLIDELKVALHGQSFREADIRIAIVPSAFASPESLLKCRTGGDRQSSAGLEHSRLLYPRRGVVGCHRYQRLLVDGRKSDGSCHKIELETNSVDLRVYQDRLQSWPH